MKTYPNTSLSNLVLLATISSSVLSLSYDTFDSLIPNIEPNYSYQKNITDWKDNAFNISSDYSINDDNSEKIHTIIEFPKRVIENSIDIESEFVDIVNENFWELI